jgi:hypothetical protein
MWTDGTAENKAMASTRQPAENKSMTTLAARPKSVRLDLSEEDQHALRRAAAAANMSTAAYARQLVSEAVEAYRPSRKRESGK